MEKNGFDLINSALTKKNCRKTEIFEILFCTEGTEGTEGMEGTVGTVETEGTEGTVGTVGTVGTGGTVGEGGGQKTLLLCTKGCFETYRFSAAL